MEIDDIPNYLYHITCKSNLESIEEYGLGARIGKGIDWKNSKQGITYFLDFDPREYLACEGNQLNDRQVDIVLTIVGLIMHRKNYISIAVIEVDTDDLDQRMLRRDEPFVWVYKGIIDDFEVDCFEVSTSKREIDESGDDQEFERLQPSDEYIELFPNSDDIYSRRIECDDSPNKDLESCDTDEESSEEEDNSEEN